MKKRLDILPLIFGLAFFSFLPLETFGQLTNSLQINGFPSISMVIRALGAGQQPEPSSHKNTHLHWYKPNRQSKITVSTFCMGQLFTLQAEANNVKKGVSVGAVLLRDGMAATDFIVNIPPQENGHAKITYVASATLDQGNSVESGADVHTVTFTLTEQ